MIERLLSTSEMLNPEVMRQLATEVRQQGDVPRAVADYSLPGLTDLYLQKIRFAAQEQGATAIALRFPHVTIDESPGGDDVIRLRVDTEGLDFEEAIRDIAEIVHEGMDERNIWTDLIKWALSNVAVWIADEIEEEYGSARFAALSNEELSDAFKERYLADSNAENKADKATEALHIYAHELANGFIESAHDLSISDLGVLLGFPRELLSPAELEAARREASAKFTDALAAWERMDRLQAESSSVESRKRRRSNAGRKKEQNQFPRDVCDEYARQTIEMQNKMHTWEEIEEELGPDRKTLQKYVREYRARGGN